MSPKYPRTPHLPYSPGGTSDDKRLSGVDHLVGAELVLTEKMDGSNVSLEASACYARSHASSPNHPSFDAFKAFHAAVKSRIPENFQVFGEWLFAKHSIAYSKLPALFQVFGVRDINTGLWGSWEEVELWAAEMGTVTVPVLARVVPGSASELQTLVTKLSRQPSLCGGDREGVVVRKACSYHDDAFSRSIAKWVREDHVSCSDHWSHQAILRNKLVI